MTNFDPKFVLNVMHPAAMAAYTIIGNPNPPLPTGYALAATIVAEADRVQALVASVEPQHLRMAQAMLAGSNIFGLVAYNSAIKTAIVSFRGTQSPEDWLGDIDAVPAPYLAAPGMGLVHLGFQIVYEHVRHSLSHALTANCPDCQRVLVTGHSLGGALALLSAPDIARNVTPAIVPELYTFAGPRTGALSFQAPFNTLIPTCYRVVNKWDIVPTLPPPGIYEHVGEAEVVDGGFTLDPLVAHSLNAYAAGLRKLLPAA
jgi:predicted lipase